MRITIHHTKFYDWDPVPADTQVTEADLKNGLVKPGIREGEYTMRVTKTADEPTHTDVQLPESELIQMIIRDAVKENVILTRQEALGHYLARHTIGHHAHRDWIDEFEVLDDGGEPEVFEATVREHIAAGNIKEIDFEALMEAYGEPFNTKELSDHLHERIKTKKGRKAKKESA